MCFPFFSGQEIDFLQLLYSFGVDSIEIAKAMGMDVDELTRLDKDVLVHMLTSHSNTD